VRTADFDFDLPPQLIAQHPTRERDGSRLLVMHRDSHKLEHRLFPDLLEYLTPDDLVIMNNSRVFPARLRGANVKTGGRFEMLLLEEVGLNEWWAMLRPGKRARIGTRIVIQTPVGIRTDIEVTVVGQNAEGHRRVQFRGVENILTMTDEIGEIPLPPYITRPEQADLSEDRDRYQTVFASTPGSVAAPTAGLHFTPGLIERLQTRKVPICFVTLHVGLGTFAPVKSVELSGHTMHEERYEVSYETAEAVRRTKARGGRIFSVGTTTLRVLESVAKDRGEVISGSGRTSIFIYPPYSFKVVDALLTNFHLPRSTLLMLVSAFASPAGRNGREEILRAYAEAINHHYRFFSYGDAMLIV
jgi:S-adenosylmethionine:tRNA ribosyltransferase-isomerase